MLRQRTFFTGRPVHADGSTDLAWYDADGEPMVNGRWEDPGTRTVQMFLDGAWLEQRSLLLLLHGDAHDTEVTLPAPPGLTAYELLWDSALEVPAEVGPAVPPGPVEVTGASFRVYRALDAP